MSGKVAELRLVFDPDNLANSIIYMYDTWGRQRKPWINECLELRDYVFATDTTKTSNQFLPWKNSTTLPKMAQIRDNLHANYMSALFPNDDWLKWEGYTLDDDTIEKKEAIQAYMSNKTREGNFKNVVSQALYDYIDYGNAFGDVSYSREMREDPVTGDNIPGYIGPVAIRISPLDHVINPTAASYKDSPKFTRTIKTLGELKVDAEDFADKSFFDEAIRKSEIARDMATNRDGHYTIEDFEKAAGYSIDGFGNLKEYYQSPFVEIIEIEGDIHDPSSGILLRNHVITIIDRSHVVRKEPIPSWLGKSAKAHVGWRLRPDNLYAMGPLSNLVGMQYRIDHLENLKADVFDLIAYPPLKIIGEVEDFDWAPGAEIHIDEDGDVQMLTPDTTALNADTQIQLLEQRMEEFAGAPKQAMGIRTPGEKTAFEVQALENAAGRIFQEKISNFEVNWLEPILNSMLETARRNIDGGDVVRVMDDDLGVTKFMSITREDITANGKLRPIGARHFAARAQLMQNLTGVFNSPVGQMIAPHVSSKEMAKLVEDSLGLNRFALISDNVAVAEQAETQRLMNQSQEDLDVEAQTPLEQEEV
jgi:hypothetical protein